LQGDYSVLEAIIGNQAAAINGNSVPQDTHTIASDDSPVEKSYEAPPRRKLDPELVATIERGRAGVRPQKIVESAETVERSVGTLDASLVNKIARIHGGGTEKPEPSSEHTESKGKSPVSEQATQLEQLLQQRKSTPFSEALAQGFFSPSEDGDPSTCNKGNIPEPPPRPW